mgnify:CR=1 FL=1
MSPSGVIQTGHTANIFGVAWLAGGGDRRLVTGGMDRQVRLHEVGEAGASAAARAVAAVAPQPTGRRPAAPRVAVARSYAPPLPAAPGWTSRLLRTHADDVEGVAASPDDPTLFWSAGGDGVIVEYDTRTLTGGSGRAPTNGRDIIVLKYPVTTPAMTRAPPHYGVMTEHLLEGRGAAVGKFRSIAVSPTNGNHLLAACSDPFVRLYDRRMLPPTAPTASLREHHRNVMCFAPLQCTAVDDTSGIMGYHHVTYAEFDATGRSILGTFAQMGTYVFDALGAEAGDGAVRLGAPPAADATALWDVAGGAMATRPPPAARSRNPPTLLCRAPPPPPPPPSPQDTTLVTTTAPPASVPTDVAATLRAAGNDAFRLRHFLAAEALYAAGLAAARWAARAGVGVSRTDMALLYLNRAAAYLNRKTTGDGDGVVADAYAALAADGSQVKARYRLVRGLMAAKLYAKAAMHARALRAGTAGGEGDAEAATLVSDAQAAYRTALARHTHLRIGDPRTTPLLLRNPVPQTQPAVYPDTFLPPGDASRQQAPATVQDALYAPLHDGEYLCLRHTGYYAGASTMRTSIAESSFWPTIAGIELRAALRRLAAAAADAAASGRDREAALRAGFTGGAQGYIVAGSDTGDILLFDRESAALVTVLSGAVETVNCVRPHPTLPVLASSGIETACRLWAPAPPARATAAADGDVALDHGIRRVTRPPPARLDEYFKAGMAATAAGIEERMASASMMSGPPPL